ncbi:major facilitator superfamily domain-containing protein [Armillaria luteobubalina]|uniref:Major facilitator superfamily domain-containing protein n=1 Tax=Armillaria luteobubalina TaxID=153913 RepID=A0AA39PY58_9AGAR|nr:major facilitator superfamily domain-containing protein [Armillaria luteobubalina]
MSTTQNITAVPGPFGLPRIMTLLASLLVALGAGTNYVYSAYAPQMGHRLKLSHTQLNLIALGGNVGVYSTGPVWGKIVDSRGPRILMVASFTLLLLGYSGIRHVYDAGLRDDQSTITTLTFCMLALFGFMTGAGGNSALSGAVNSTAKSFPERLRASTTGVVLSGFGLSAFLFSSIAHFAFPGDTSSFLLVLSLGTALPEVVGYFFIRPIPLPASEQRYVPEEDAEAVPYHENSSRTRLLVSEDEDHVILHHASPTTPAKDFIPGAADDLELSPSRSMSPPQINIPRNRSRSSGRSFSLAGRSLMYEKPPNIYGRKLWCTLEFWLMCSILSLLSGTGLMYINNVGSMSQALFAHNNPTYDEDDAIPWQAAQVSAISIMNCLGRIVIGLISDFCKHHYGMPRCYNLVLVSFLVLLSQILASQIDDVRHLWQASTLLGLAYGSIFGIYPTLCIEWFGMPHFSENWGYISLAPMAGGNLFSLAFGNNLDAHEPKDTKSEATVMRGDRQCLEGKACYVDTLYLAIAGCFLALGLSVYACWRDRQKHAYDPLDWDDEAEEEEEEEE